MASVDFEDFEHHSNIRLFKWDVEISIGKPDDDKWIRANGVILLRASVGAATTEVFAVPYTIPDVEGTGLLRVLHETMKRLHMLGSVEYLDWIAYDILAREFTLKFGLITHLLVRYSDDVLVMFFDLKINQASDMIPCIPEALDMINKEPHISNLEVNAEINLNKVEEIEECLKACHGMVVEKSGGMEEIKGSMEMVMLTGSEENDAECPICLGKMVVGYRHAKTCCGHKFHKVCMTQAMQNIMSHV